MKSTEQYTAVTSFVPDGYKPRTRHLDEKGRARFTNRLFIESSPYLLQHAHNPVNWYPWGDEAFEAAAEKQRPVLLSVGYATCHWCHVMEEESFEDLEVAAFINDNFIPVKVDREERLDVDSIYMAAVQATTGRGGWPMTVCLTPERKPFFAGTYFPARDGDRGSVMGFLTILRKIREAWDTKKETINDTSFRVTEAVQKMLAPETAGELPGASVMHNAVNLLKQRFDRENGGASGAPKFPATMPTTLLFTGHRRTRDKALGHMAEKTLMKMADGGIYDQAGGGFHRYATDEKWLVPHFEKMLYDNALLAAAYLHGFQAAETPRFRQVTDETLGYIQREMTSPDGAFFAATDADSIGHDGISREGAFFTWTRGEIDGVLDKEAAEAVALYFDVTDQGNFEGRSILHVAKPLAEVAATLGKDQDALFHLIETAKETLYRHRQTRPAPIRDEKIITAWNGLMISAFAKAGRVLGTPRYTAAAKKAATFVLDRLCREGRLFRSYKDDTARHNGFLEDYAFFTAGLLDLYAADKDDFWLDRAVMLDQTLASFYEDREGGGFFMTAHDHEPMIAREKPMVDNAVPSGNAVAAMNLLRLYAVTGEKGYKQRAEKTFKAFSTLFESNPLALPEMIAALDYYLEMEKNDPSM